MSKLRKLQQFFKFCLAMIHLEPLTSLGSFLSTLEAIHTQPNPWVILRCWLLLFFYASLAVHFLSLVFLPLSAIDRILVYDILYLLIPQRAVNLFACAAIHLGAYAYKQLHFNGQLFPHFNLLECLLNGSACRFFLCKRKASCRLIRQLYWQFGATFRCLRIAVGKSILLIVVIMFNSFFLNFLLNSNYLSFLASEVGC